MFLKLRKKVAPPSGCPMSTCMSLLGGVWTPEIIWNLSEGQRRFSELRRATFLQPFVSYTTKNAWTFGLNTESTYNWENHDWSVPINLTVSKLVRVNKQPISLLAGLRYWATAPDSGPSGLGVRVAVTFLFPK